MIGKKAFVDFHVIQTIPPNCVNRDDTGSPKTAIYGGVRRARVSSQSWKHAMRLMFRECFSEAELGVRTKKIVDLVAEQITLQDLSISREDALSMAEKTINAAAIKTTNAEAKALFFMSVKQSENLAKLALKSHGEPSKKEAQAALMAGHGVDIALFGRMVADDPSLNVDASAQIAHSISTHRIENEYDYFTAVDDRSPKDNAGAGMIGTVEYNSATLYRYATVAVHELRSQLAKDSEATAKAVKEFAHAFITSMPTGKQNTFANRTLPDAVVVALRGDQPVNMAGAFEKPVMPSSEDGGGFVKESVNRLMKYAQSIHDIFANAPEKTWLIGETLSPFGETTEMKAFLDGLERHIIACLVET